MNAYYYNSDAPIKGLMGFNTDGEGEVTEETLEGVYSIDSEQDFRNYVEIFAVKGDVLFVIHDGTYTQFTANF